jgi:hypothetical protein
LWEVWLDRLLLLLGIRHLSSLLRLPLVNSLLHGWIAISLPCLRLFALSSINRAHKANITSGLPAVIARDTHDKGRPCCPCNMLLLPS